MCNICLKKNCECSTQKQTNHKDKREKSKDNKKGGKKTYSCPDSSFGEMFNNIGQELPKNMVEIDDNNTNTIE